MIQFKDTDFNFEHPLVPGTKDNYVFWEFMGDVKKIVHYHPGCGCTAGISITGNSSGGKIEATYEETNVGSNMEKISNKNSKEYINGIININKYVDVYLDDGKPLYKQNGMKKDFNPDKKKIRLWIRGQVDFRALKAFHEGKVLQKKKVNA